jgi:hypothetical protein
MEKNYQSLSLQPPADLLESDLFDFEKKDSENTEDLVVTKFNPKHTNDIMRLNSAVDYSGHIDNVQNDLDTLKDLLSSDSYLDTNQLLGVSESKSCQSSCPISFLEGE